MKRMKFLDNLGRFFVIIDRDMSLKMISKNLLIEPEFKEKINDSLLDFLGSVFLHNQFKNTKHVEEVMDCVEEFLIQGKDINKSFTVSNQEITDCYIKYTLNMEILDVDETLFMIGFTNFNRFNVRYDFKNQYFNKYNSKFIDLMDSFEIGRFIIDCKSDDESFYADDYFAKLFMLEKSKDYRYYLSNISGESIDIIVPFKQSVLSKYHQLLNGDIQRISDVCESGERILQINAMVMERDSQNHPLIIGGIVEDISEYQNYDKINHLKSIYDLAITCGGIGIFYYDVDVYGEDHFEANQIYADLLGIEPNEQGLYNVSDFEKSIVKIEDELSFDQDIRKSLKKLLAGQLDGTTDDIVKIKNLKTGDEKYLLSSSKIDERFENGKPKSFGGFIIDITERMISEKNKSIYAYTDELTSLPNKRRLYKDMQHRDQGIGLFMDIDDFKKVNDKYGHLVGDKVLSIIASAIQTVVKRYEGVYPYRLYGDEFFVFISNKDDEMVAKIIEDINHETCEALKTLNLKIFFSFGYSYLEEGMDTDQLIKDSDYNMYKEKIQKKESRNKKK